jgi:MFS family permease
MGEFTGLTNSAPAGPNDGTPWYKLLNRYHWFVLGVAALGWLFDTMDQQLFNLARTPAMRDLIPEVTAVEAVEREADRIQTLRDRTPADASAKDQADVARQEATLTQLRELIDAADTSPAASEKAAEATKDLRAGFTKAVRAEYAGGATAIFLMGWATGGLIFGVLGDRFGRAKVMMWTILVYSLCTGLSALSTGFWDFAVYRFLTGLGVGGEFAVGVALVAEVMPDRARPFALGWLQALSAVGNISAALISMSLGHLETTGVVGNFGLMGFKMTAWRLMFVIGTLPALLAILIRSRLKEPERWQHSAHEGATRKTLGLYHDLFSDPRWRHNAIVGMCLAFAGVVGLWGIGFFSFDLIDVVFRKHFEAQGLSPQEVAGEVGWWKGITSVLQNVGGFFGIYAYARMTHITGRKPAFAVAFVAAMLSTALVFWSLDDFSDIFWMIPLMGFCQLAIFGGYAIYFPELFPTRLRSTGTSFCYNVGRFVAAVGPFTFGLLTSRVFVDMPREPMRYAGLVMCTIFLIGLVALPFAPETKGQPLPE